MDQEDGAGGAAEDNHDMQVDVKNKEGEDKGEQKQTEGGSSDDQRPNVVASHTTKKLKRNRSSPYPSRQKDKEKAKEEEKEKEKQKEQQKDGNTNNTQNNNNNTKNTSDNKTSNDSQTNHQQDSKNNNTTTSTTTSTHDEAKKLQRQKRKLKESRSDAAANNETTISSMKNEKNNKPTKSEKSNTPTKNGKTPTPTKEEKSSSPTKDENAATPTKDANSTTPTNSNKSTTPTKDDKSNTPTKSKRSTTPTKKEKSEQPEKIQTNNNTERKEEDNKASKATVMVTSEINDDGDDKTELFEDEPKEIINLTLPLGSDEKFVDTWNDEYVRLPFAAQNTFRKKSNPEKALSRWELIGTVLESEISDSADFEEVVKAYNSRKGFDFSGLHDFFDSECDEMESKLFFSEILPKMIKLARSLPSLLHRPIPLLMKHVDQEILLSQHQIAALLANGFLCTFPTQGAAINIYPSINFSTLFESPCTPKKAAKLKAIIHYFDRVTSNMPKGNVSFHRQVLDDFPEWEECTLVLPDLIIEKNAAIEDKGTGLLEVDFANKMIGGGVLGSGSVQEEIRFVINPELIVSRLFTSKIEDNEVVIMKGTERFSVYKGYSDNFEWVGDFEDKADADELGRLDTTIVAMDAIHLKKPSRQYSLPLLERELNKAYCGFHAPGAPLPLPAVATGNWGCGVFGGDKHLKSMLQLMAAAPAQRNIVYFTFSDEEFGDRLSFMHSILREKNVTIAQLFKAFTEFNAIMSEAKSSLEIFDYLEIIISTC